MAEPWIDLDLTLPVGPATLRAQARSAAPAIGVVGPSGAGKSTLLRALAGVGPRGTGSLRVFGQPWQDARSFVPAHARGVGWTPQDAALFPHLTVRQNLGYGGADGLDDIAAMLGLGGLLDRAPRHLSGGEAQRVALGRALLRGPRLLLLDEPFAALDRALRARVAADVAAWCAARRVAVVLVTHDERDLAPFDAERWDVADGALRPQGAQPV